MKKRFPFTYEQAESRLTDYETGRLRKASRLCQNTYLEARKGGAMVIRLHAVDLITLRDDGTCELYVGEYFTNTSFDRLCSYCPVPIERNEKGEWFVTVAGLHKVAFRNGMMIDNQGRLVS